ncbi:hypothetical protein TELCIR_03932 [Teladorsagia circumcincta]|uniref:Uncharacterized protein n=1 Tax=Teladorsagia circumcincta TaxID=45464 RepID=A0A2G9UV89_TELCI|nr:hypothetical protein TELCIR_03932 [Teladorsagia circumcincta]
MIANLADAVFYQHCSKDKALDVDRSLLGCVTHTSCVHSRYGTPCGLDYALTSNGLHITAADIRHRASTHKGPDLSVDTVHVVCEMLMDYLSIHEDDTSVSSDKTYNRWARKRSSIRMFYDESALGDRKTIRHRIPVSQATEISHRDAAKDYRVHRNAGVLMS